MTEIQALERLIFSTLNGDATLAGLIGEKPDSSPAIYMGGLADQTTTRPYITVEVVTATDNNAQGFRINVNAVVMVTIVGDGNVPEYDAAAQVDALLHRTTTMSEGYPITLERMTQRSVPYVDGGKTFRHVVTGYRAFIAIPD